MAMKISLNVLVLALAATAVAATGTAYLGIWEPVEEETPIDARAINTGIAKKFKKVPARTRQTVLLKNQGSLEGDSGRPDDDCKYEIGVKFIGRETFCGLDLIAFRRDDAQGGGDVVMVMRFLGTNGGNMQYRIEIPIFQLSGKDEVQDEFNFIDDDWYDRIRIDCSVDEVIPFYFGWFEFLVQHGLLFTDEPNVVEGKEHKALTYLAHPVYLPAEVMNKLRLAIR